MEELLHNTQRIDFIKTGQRDKPSFDIRRKKLSRQHQKKRRLSAKTK